MLAENLDTHLHILFFDLRPSYPFKIIYFLSKLGCSSSDVDLFVLNYIYPITLQGKVALDVTD